MILGVLPRPHVTVERRHLGRQCFETVTADSGKQGRRKALALPPDLSKEGQRGQRRLVHGSIIGILWFIAIELKQIFYSFLYYFWGQHCCWTVASTIGNDFFVFHKFPLPSTFLLTPSAIDVPASLHTAISHCCLTRSLVGAKGSVISPILDCKYPNVEQNLLWPCKIIYSIHQAVDS